MKKLVKMAIAAAVAAFAAAESRAATAAFSYQGVLLNEAGTAPLSGNKKVEIRLYDMPAEGAALWGRTYSVLLDTNGLFNVEVSDATGSALSDAPGTALSKVFADSAKTTLYIGLTVDGSSGEIAPRQKLLAVPYATFASDVARASGDFAVAGTLTAKNLTVTNTLTAGSMTVSGQIGASELRTTGSATVNGNLSVNGSISGIGSVPIKGIIMWSGTTVPDGWALCDGTGGTPDLRGRFIVGAGAGPGLTSYAVNAVGGAETVTLSKEQMPSHTHEVYGRYCGYTGSHNNDAEVITYADKSWGGWSKRINTTESAGGGQPHDNMPPYYALAFIMRMR